MEQQQSRIAVVAIIVENLEATAAVNAILHEMCDYVVGRMGLPYKKRDVNLIAVVLDAPAPVINAATGKLGMLEGVTAKALFSSK